MDALDRKIRQLEIEIVAIKREKDTAKINRINKELGNLKEERNTLFYKWNQEKEVVDSIQKTKSDIEQLRMQDEQAEREGNYGEVAEIRYGKLQKAQNELEQLQLKLKSQQNEGSLIKEEVVFEDIAEVIAKWTGIPVQKMLQSDREKLLHLETHLQKRIVGQEKAVEALSDAIRRSRSGLQDEQKPIGSFLFLGTTGVGKTELAKALAEQLFDHEKNMTHIDMSEFQEKHAVSRLIGAPPGYVGYEEGGQLTEAVRRKPYSVILLDEIEKAHPDTFNILLQVLDEGRLTDNKGRVADFRNSIIIMTSNMGSGEIQTAFKTEQDFSEAELLAKKLVLEKLKNTIRLEFLNRIDDILVFSPLTRNEIKQIVSLQFQAITNRLNSKNIKLQATEEAVSHLAQLSFDPQFGARPIKRVLQKQLVNKLSKELLNDTLKSDQTITIDAFEGQLVFKNEV